MSAQRSKAVERHREALETLADSDLDLQLVEDARELLEEDEDGDGR